MDIYTIQKPAQISLPIVLSVPHAGICIPPDIQSQLKTNYLPPDDTDWFVHQLYQFATALNLPLIKANYSRWVVDLNRNPGDEPLYNDGRVITSLCTTTNFAGNSIYKDQHTHIAPEEISQRKHHYFLPYHHALQSLLNDVKQQFGSVLLWDCHSIRRYIPAIHPEPFPDLILGSASNTSAASSLTQTVLASLQNSSYAVSHNHPFRGGYITRHYGQPAARQHALQLEMAKPIYMDDTQQQYDETRAAAIISLLRQTLLAAGTHVLSLAP